MAHVREVASGSLRSTCSSWYIGANVPGKPRVFLPHIGGFPAYVQKCDAALAALAAVLGLPAEDIRVRDRDQRDRINTSRL